MRKSSGTRLSALAAGDGVVEPGSPMADAHSQARSVRKQAVTEVR